LKWLALSLLAYPITVFLVKQPWPELLRATFVPRVELGFDFLFMAIAVLGTSISPYLFFWEASEEVEEERARHMIRNGKPRFGEGFMRRLRIDNFIGMLSSQVVMWCIVVVGGTVLHGGGITEVGTAAEAAKALEPLVNTFPNSGFLAQLIFAFGIIGLGFLAVPVLSGSAAYALAEAFNWKEGLNRSFRRAHGFYGVIIVSTIIGLLINFVGIDPIKALIFAAVFNGVAAVPLIMVIALIARREDIMGEHKSGRLSKTLVWATFALMAASAIGMFIALGKG
jgi:Mn2+/Fe2+ NRAMP family transporter